MDTIEKNKLIAKFMGCVENPNNGVWNTVCPFEGKGHHPETMKYQGSWDWLMPVVERINVVTKYDDYNQNRLHIQRVLDDCINENAVGIEEVHKAVVEFIKQYNK